MKGSIYKITNDINDKAYVGKTLLSIEERFKEHKQDYQKTRCEKRPLYNAMNKYGVEHFQISLIEECPIEILSEREKYWIKELGTYHNGYNATLGGDGKRYIDYDLVISLYNKYQSIIEVAKEMNISKDQAGDILHNNNVSVLNSSEVLRNKKGKRVNMYDLQNNFLKSFLSLGDAANYLIENNLTNCKFGTNRYHISEVCRGKRKTAAKFIWKFLE